MDRERIPANTKRIVRQRCGFGCVMCGSPVFDYEHILGYAQTGNDPDFLTLLCPTEHREKTAGRLPVPIVERANRNPHNTQRKVGARHPLYFEGPKLSVDLGNVTIETELDDGEDSFALTVDDQPIIGARRTDNRLELEMLLRDRDNVPYLVVRGGELRHSTRMWDVEFVGQTLTVRAARGDVALRITLEPPDRIVIERADIWANGMHFLVGAAAPRGGFQLVNNLIEFSSLTIAGRQSWLNVGSSLPEPRQTFRLPVPKRVLGGDWPPVGAFRKAW